KAIIEEWLVNQYITFEPDMVKAELLALLKQHALTENNRRVSERDEQECIETSSVPLRA
ncbi:hypothetical protein ILUMI_14875, partial [Ignelater luminosus]